MKILITVWGRNVLFVAMLKAIYANNRYTKNTLCLCKCQRPLEKLRQIIYDYNHVIIGFMFHMFCLLHVSLLIPEFWIHICHKFHILCVTHNSDFLSVSSLCCFGWKDNSILRRETALKPPQITCILEININAHSFQRYLVKTYKSLSVFFCCVIRMCTHLDLKSLMEVFCAFLSSQINGAAVTEQVSFYVK